MDEHSWKPCFSLIQSDVRILRVRYIKSNSQLEWFSPFLWNRWKNCHMSYRTQRTLPSHATFFCVYFITKWQFPRDHQWIYCCNSSTMRCVWIFISYLFWTTEEEITWKMTKISSTELPCSGIIFLDKGPIIWHLNWCCVIYQTDAT